MPSSTSSGLTLEAWPSRFACRENTPAAVPFVPGSPDGSDWPRPDADQQMAVRAANGLARPGVARARFDEQLAVRAVARGFDLRLPRSVTFT